MTPEQLEQEITRNYTTKGVDLRSGGNRRFKLLLTYLSYKWGQLAPRQALERVNSISYFDSEFIAPLIVRGWAELDPERAASHFSEYRDDLPSSKELLRVIAGEMGRAAPDISLKWLSALDKKQRQCALSAFFSGMADARPGQWTHYIGQVTTEDMLRDLLLAQRLAAQGAIADWKAACEWINTLHDEDSHNAASGTVWWTLGSHNPSKAAEEFKKQDQETQKKIAADIASGMARNNPTQALDWLLSNTSEETAAQTLYSAVNQATYQNVQLKEYIARLPEGQIKDAALSTLINHAFNRTHDTFVNLEDALNLAKGIRDNQKRIDCITNQLNNNWCWKEPEKARAWIESSDLPEQIKAEAIKNCEKTIERKKDDR